MAKYVLVSDTTLSHDYKNFPLLDFLPSAPTELLPEFIYNYLKGKPPPAIDGRASLATYPLRKIESALLQKHKTEDVVVAHEDHIEDFIGDDTEIIGVTTMDPFGLAPLTMSYALLFGLTGPAYVKKEFTTLLERINRARNGKKAKLVVGGPGVWELTVHPDEMEKNHIDYAYQGESEDIIDDLFHYILDDSTRSGEFFRGFQTFDSNYHKSWVGDNRFISRYQFSKQFPKLEDIPEIVNPTIKGFIESMRGCGIGCDFCEVTLRPLRYYPPEKVLREIAVNVKAGLDNVWLHSDEIFAYNHGKNYVPDGDALARVVHCDHDCARCYTHQPHAREDFNPGCVPRASEETFRDHEGWSREMDWITGWSGNWQQPIGKGSHAEQDASSENRPRRYLVGNCLERNLRYEQVLLAACVHCSGRASGRD